MRSQNTNDRLSLGFVGGGVNSAVGYTHFLASRMDGFFEVDAGFFSRDAEVNMATASAYGVSPTRCYGSLEEMLESERESLDALCILTPIPDHIHSVTKAMRAGFDVICEKALASSLQEAKIIQDTEEETQKRLLVTFNYIGYPMVREARAMIERGALGDIQQIFCEMPQESFAQPDTNPQAWRRRDYGLPCVTLDLGVHVLHMMQYLINGEGFDPTAATVASFGKVPDVLDTVNAIGRCRFQPILWNATWTKAALGNANGLKFRVFGSEGSVEWYQANPEELHHADKFGLRMVLERGRAELREANDARYNRFKAGHPAGFVEAFANIYSDFYQILVSSDREDTVYGTQSALAGLSDLHLIHDAAFNPSV